MATMTALDAGKTTKWEATSADGRWVYVRVEDTGTHWDVLDTRTGQDHLYVARSLAKCRHETAVWDASDRAWELAHDDS